MASIELAKKICKEHGVKGFRKLALKKPTFIAGRQCKSISDCIAERLLNRLIEEGFTIAQPEVAFSLAKKGLLDCITIYN